MSVKTILIVGIGGVTCGGKTTTAIELNKMIPGSKLFSQDDYFLDVDDKRHTWIPQLNHINFDIVSSLDMKKMHKDILEYIAGYKRLRHNGTNTNADPTVCVFNCEDLKKYWYHKLQHIGIHIVIIEGFCIFNYQPMQDIFDLKYYFTLDRDECYRRRLTRIYEPPDCPGYFDLCVWPEHLQQLTEVKRDFKDVTYFSEKSKNPIHEILLNLLRILNTVD